MSIYSTAIQPYVKYVHYNMLLPLSCIMEETFLYDNLLKKGNGFKSVAKST